MLDRFTKLFPLWAVIFSVIAYYFNNFFSGFRSAIVPLLAVIMFGMGMTLTWDNFKKIFKSPLIIIIGFGLQYLIMPAAGYFVSVLFNLSPIMMAGVVLVGSSPGGTASNVITYLGNGDVALSITLTLTSTIFATFLTPFFSYIILNHVVPVPAVEMFLDILQIVLIPVLAGTAINSLFSRRISNIRNIFPLISTLAIVFIIAIIVALNKSKIAEMNSIIVAAVITHNIIGLSFGYFVPKLLKFDKKICRTICIEVGMQNSGLSVALAVKFFSASAALPGAIFSIWHNLSGSMLAGWWRIKDEKFQKNRSTGIN
jgi:bile acid:Na+ symporter, BASS family